MTGARMHAYIFLCELLLASLAVGIGLADGVVCNGIAPLEV